jgi:hypothetical protein
MAKQSELAIKGRGVEAVRIAQIDSLAEAYIKERDKRLKLTPREVAAKTKLVDALHKHSGDLRQPDGTLVYRYDEMVITLTPGKEKLRVKELDEEDED